MAVNPVIVCRKTTFRIFFTNSHFLLVDEGNDSNLLIVFYVQIMPDDLVMQLHRF
ncbi:pilus assembly protein [Shigella flexneri]|nr:pilus assembly protein [Shigella flexneri]